MTRTFPAGRQIRARHEPALLTPGSCRPTAVLTRPRHQCPVHPVTLVERPCQASTGDMHCLVLCATSPAGTAPPHRSIPLTQPPAPTLHNFAHLADLLQTLGQDCALLLRDDSPLTATVIHEHLARIAPYAAGLVTLAAAPNAPYRDSDQEHRARPRIALAAQDTHWVRIL
jgi:hypothetical protein